jgi:small subunit ribosomal protein S24e
MEIEIQSKTNNSLFNRTEVYFIIHHEGESTPKRDLIKSELAGKLNAKKENIMINFMKSSFGTTTTEGYAKVYNSLKEAKEREKDHILVRNGALVKEKKPVKEEKPKPPAEKPTEGDQKPQEETVEKPGEEKKEESIEKSANKEKIGEEKSEPASEEKSEEKKVDENSEKSDSKDKSDEEKKE